MAYVLAAFLGDDQALQHLTNDCAAIDIVHLSHGLSIAPFMASLRKAMESIADVGDPDAAWPFRRLSSRAADRAMAASIDCDLAYVEAEYFGGDGEQAAILWRHGKVVIGPIRVGDSINRVLRDLGVQAGSGQDEFDVIGLGKNRFTEEWLATNGQSKVQPK